MISDKLYQLAFEYKKTKLWKKLWDTDLFAMQPPDGPICYISVMGAAGDHCAIGAYIGEEGLRSFMSVARTDPSSIPPIKLQEYFLQQDCLQCSFENKDELSNEEHEEAKAYARSHGIRIAGKKAYPQFRRFTPNHLPWHLQMEQEQDLLCQVLESALALSRLLEDSFPEDLGFQSVYDNPEEIPLLEYQDGSYVLKKTKLPPETPAEIPTPTARNDIGIASLKRIKKNGIWECEIIRFPQPVQNASEEIPYFPVTLLAVESSTGYILQVPPVVNYEEDPEHLLNLFIEALVNENVRPVKIKVRDARTHAFAKPLCDRLKIPLSTDEDMPALDDAEADFMAHFNMNDEEQMDNLNEILDNLLEMGDAQLRTLPDEMLSIFQMLSEQEDLPGGLQEKLQTLLSPKDAMKTDTFKVNRGRPKKKPKLSGPPHSYVISVSLGTGCYRHIQIAGDAALFELHGAILDAFGFVDDHAHAFFMDNISWSDYDCYYVDGIESYYRTTDRYTLDQADLHTGMKFKYIFDFGDEWTFQCKVLRIAAEACPRPVILKTKGDAPKQYGDQDDDGWDD